MTGRRKHLVERLQAEYGESLRAVATYDRDGYEVHYVDEAGKEHYSPEDIDAIYQDVVLQDLEQPLQERLFDDMGTNRGKIRLFEDGTAAHFWPTEEDEGLFIAFDDRADPGVRSLLALVDEFYS